MLEETNNFPLHITSLSSSHHVNPCMYPTILIFDPFIVQFPSNRGGLFLPLRIMSAWASPQHLRVPAAYRAGSRLRAEMSREDEQHWEWVSTNAQSAKAAGRRSEGVSEQVRSPHDAPSSAAEKTAGVGNKRPDKPGPGDRRPVPPRDPFCSPAASHDGFSVRAN